MIILIWYAVFIDLNPKIKFKNIFKNTLQNLHCHLCSLNLTDTQQKLLNFAKNRYETMFNRSYLEPPEKALDRVLKQRQFYADLPHVQLIQFWLVKLRF